MSLEIANGEYADSGSSKEVEAIFDPIIAKLEKLVADQMHHAEKSGFSTKVWNLLH